jgi:hypothetical protein
VKPTHFALAKALGHDILRAGVANAVAQTTPRSGTADECSFPCPFRNENLVTPPAGFSRTLSASHDSLCSMS